MSELETRRTILRRLTLQDAEALQGIMGDPEVMRFVGNNKPISLERTRALIEKTLTHFADHGCGFYAVIEKASGRFVGYSGFTLKNPDVPELGYGFEKASWGKGLGWETASAVVEFLRTHFNFRRICATVDPANTASVRILQKLGMKRSERRLDEYCLPEDLYELELGDSSAQGPG